MPVRDDIARKLREAFEPSRLEVIDESHLHAGPGGARPGGESHFRVEIAAGAFRGMSRVDRQKAVYGVLAEEMAGPVHALSIRAEDG